MPTAPTLRRARIGGQHRVRGPGAYVVAMGRMDTTYLGQLYLPADVLYLIYLYIFVLFYFVLAPQRMQGLLYQIRTDMA
jgi:hypothetical protein